MTSAEVHSTFCFATNMSTSLAAPESTQPVSTATPSTFKWLCRVCVAGLCFGAPLGAMSTVSPLIRLSLNNDNFKQLAPRITSDFFLVNFTASATAYAYFIDKPCDNPLAKNGFMPYLGPVTAQIPAMSCWVLSHCFFPGFWAIFNEKTLKTRVWEAARLSAKTWFAFAPYHGSAAVGVGAAVGLVMYPFKYAKRQGVPAQAVHQASAS